MFSLWIRIFHANLEPRSSPIIRIRSVPVSHRWSCSLRYINAREQLANAAARQASCSDVQGRRPTKPTSRGSGHFTTPFSPYGEWAQSLKNSTIIEICLFLTVIFLSSAKFWLPTGKLSFQLLDQHSFQYYCRTGNVISNIYKVTVPVYPESEPK